MVLRCWVDLRVCLGWVCVFFVGGFACLLWVGLCVCCGCVCVFVLGGFVCLSIYGTCAAGRGCMLQEMSSVCCVFGCSQEFKSN